MAFPHDKMQSEGGSHDDADPQGFAAQYRQAYSRLKLIAAAIIGDPTHAEDIVQEAAIIALEKFSQFEAGSDFAAWLAEIVRRCSLNYVRKLRDRNTRPTDPGLLARTKTDDAVHSGPWPVVADTGILIDSQTDFDDEVLRALNEIGREARCCLLLRSVQGLTYAEISQLMQIPEGTAMSHVHRSKQFLRERISRLRKAKHETPGERR